ncbi:Disease resistance protein [Corchorus olitorius]|uniref:Disease resistance protein n=1 Tax=Corchorus olitorius TaxID=93759 RepID=A0A1R3JW19_9ROSI|nr:Disease resistance protein [Corchorus olitorius]
MEAIATGAAANISSETAKGIFQEVKRHIRYVTIYKKHVEKFEEKLEMLIAKRTSVQQEVDAADRKGEKIKADVEHWRNTVDKKIEEKEKKVRDLQDKAKTKCFIGLCPNIWSRYQLSRKAEEDVAAFDELLRQCQFNGSVGYRDVPEANVDASPNGFKTFQSREKVLRDIMEALNDSTVSMIGVYGMGGVGKTTLVNEVARQAKEVKLFDWVVTVSVTQTPDILKIQEEIAELLGLELKEQSRAIRALRLRERLKKEKRVLLVLDNIWAKLDLKEVGIPWGDEEKICKILLTSRDQNILLLFDGMVSQNTLKMDVLEKNEAWDLFKKMAGDIVESSNEWRSVANEVALKCAGLPVAIATLARALRNKDLHAWKDALVKLQRPSPRNFKGIPREVYLAVELSYNYLESDEHRQTFLLCSLLLVGSNYSSITYLLRIARGLGLFPDLYTVEEALNHLLTLVSDLKAACLLHDSYSSDLFRMHDLVYDVALAIASRDNNVFALKPEDSLKDWPDGETMEKCTMINLPFVDITHFPKELKGPQLSALRLGSKNSSVEMPASFFKEMKQLKVLELINMHISFSTLSSRFLTNLQTLILNLCVLENIAIIGNLENLKSLSIVGSDVEMLPKEIGQLINLRIFDLFSCTKLKIIPYGVLSSLSRLEELNLPVSFVEWEVEKHVNQQTNATLAELKVLSHLTALEIHIPDAKSMSVDLFSRKLERFKIFIGKSWDWIDVKYEYSRVLKLSLNITDNDQQDHGIKMLLKKAEDVCLDDMKGARIALHGLMDIEEGFQHLKNLHIQNCLEIKYVISDNDSAAEKIEFRHLRSLTLESLPQLVSFSCEKNKRRSTSESQHELSLFSEKMVFPCLEKLHLSSINVERIWNHRLSDKSFCTYQNLTSLIVEGCGNLKHLLSSFMARSLVNLKCLEIVDCKFLEEIIFSEEGDSKEEVILFPQLNSLKMKNLEQLMGFCSKEYKIEFKSLKILEIDHCPRLKGFMYKSTVEENQCFSSQALFDNKFGENGNFPLEKYEDDMAQPTLWMHSTEWPMLKTLEAYHCGKLKIFDYEDDGQHDSPIQPQPPLFLLEQSLFSKDSTIWKRLKCFVVHAKRYSRMEVVLVRK